MRTLTTLITLTFCLNLSAQKDDNSLQNSLQASLNKTLKTEANKIDNFEANIDLSKNAVQLKWSKSPENTTSSFIIEKSIDQLVWKEVTTVFGAPHKSQSMEYFHLDNQPIDNISYYRLKSKDTDGKESFSNAIPVNYIKKDGATAGINLHPNFSDGNKIINIAFEEIFEKEILIVIRDTKGNEFFSKVIINIENESLVAVPIEKEIPKGDYLITATSDNQIYSQNIVVL